MKKLVTNIFLFVLPFLLLLLYTEWRLTFVQNSYSRKMSFLDRAAPGIKLLVLGSSHAHHGIDPASFPASGFNAANVSQTLYYDLALLQSRLPSLKSLKVVVIPVSYFSLDTFLSETPEKWRLFFYDRFCSISPGETEGSRLLDLRRFSLIALYGPEKSRGLFLKGFRGDLSGDIRENGWAPLETGGGATAESGKKRAEFHQALMKKENFTRNAAWLEEMLILLKSRNVIPYLVTLPVCPTYFDHVDRSRYALMQERLQAIAARHNVVYRNYMTDDRFSSSNFSDNDHLNSRGAALFSKILYADLVASIPVGTLPSLP
jgi:hypothetical protein